MLSLEGYRLIITIENRDIIAVDVGVPYQLCGG